MLDERCIGDLTATARSASIIAHVAGVRISSVSQAPPKQIGATTLLVVVLLLAVAVAVTARAVVAYRNLLHPRAAGPALVRMV